MIAAAALATLPGRDPVTARGFDHFYNLEFDQAIAIFRKAVAAGPDEPHLRNHLAQAILYRQLLRAGALETELVTGGNAFLRRAKMNPSSEDAAEFQEAISTAMKLSQARLDKNPDDIGALYTLGVSHGLQANYHFLVHKSWRAALRDAGQCRKLHSKVTDLDPGLIDPRLTQGVHDYVIGSLPWTYRALGFVVGFRGDRDEGIRTVERVWREGSMNRSDAGVLLATVYRREKRPADAVKVLESLIKSYPRNYLFWFELGQMYSDLGDKEKALASIAEVEKLKQRLNTPALAALPIEKVFYFRATVQFWYLDLDRAAANFERVTRKASELDLNTGATAWMRLGQTYDLLGRREAAVGAYRKAIDYAPGSYRAKESEGYLRSPYQRKQG